MPYANVAALTDDDIHAVFQYLKGIPTTGNGVPQPIPPGTTQAPDTGQALAPGQMAAADGPERIWTRAEPP